MNCNKNCLCVSKYSNRSYRNHCNNSTEGNVNPLNPNSVKRQITFTNVGYISVAPNVDTTGYNYESFVGGLSASISINQAVNSTNTVSVPTSSQIIPYVVSTAGVITSCNVKFTIESSTSVNVIPFNLTVYKAPYGSTIFYPITTVTITDSKGSNSSLYISVVSGDRIVVGYGFNQNANLTVSGIGVTTINIV